MFRPVSFSSFPAVFRRTVRFPCNDSSRSRWFSSKSSAESVMNGHRSEKPVRISVRVQYAFERIKLPEMDKRMAGLEKSNKPWFLSSDRDWSYYSRKPENDDEIENQNPAARKASHVAISKRGPVVYVNCDETATKDFERVLASDAVASRLRRSPECIETLTVGVDPDMDAWCGRRNDVITVQRLDLDNVKVLSAVMAQTVVLQHYEDLVDRLHEVVATLNTHVEKRDLKKLDTEALYKMLAENDQIAGDILLSGLHNISQPGNVGWNDGRYEQLQLLLEEEFELTDRYDEMERKLAFVAQLVKQCLQLKKDQSMERLEWLIVLILTFEVLLSLRHWYFD